MEEAYQLLTVAAAAAFAYSMFASRLEKTPINGALVYVIAGLILGPSCLKILDVEVEGEALGWLAELTLAVVLFTDSATADLGVLRRIGRLPSRLLLIGLPLTIIAGTLFGMLVFPDLGWVEVALLSTMLAPTDAALGKAVVTNEKIPSEIRQSLNVESGLNDGICVPVLLLFLAIATEQPEGWDMVALGLDFALMKIGIGALVAIVLGVGGGIWLRASSQRGWISGSWLTIPVVALAILSFALSEWLGGSGFIASFVGGMVFGAVATNEKESVIEAAEGTGDVLAMLTWTGFGTVLLILPERISDWHVWVYAIASLTFLRMVPVMISMWRFKFKLSTQLFIGWFGPRGLASIVFAVIVAREDLPHVDVLIATTTLVIMLSVIAHGLSANPLATRYSQQVADGKI